MHKTLAFLLTVCILFTMSPVATYADTLPETNDGQVLFSDVSGHWASEAIYKWSGLGVIKGDSSRFRPNDSITRAEMAVILDNLMDYQKRASNSFRDVDNSAWYADAILKANAAGILNGDGAGHATPSAQINREQAAAMMARAFAVDESDGSQTLFKDAESISPWAKNLVFGMEEDKYIGGISNGIFDPKASITRAQVVTIIDNAVKAYYTKQGTYKENVNPDEGANCVAIIRADGITIKGSIIDGDLIIAEGVAQGNFTLDSSTVTGKLVARGGGENSIHIINGAAVNGRVSIERVDGIVRVVSDGVVIANLDASTEVILEGDFANVTVGEGADVEVRGAVANIYVEAKASVTVAKDAKIGTLKVEKHAEGTRVEVSGAVTNIITEAPKTEVIAKETAKIAKVEAAATATGTDLAIDKNAEVKTLYNATEITTSGSGTPKAVTGAGTVTQKQTSGQEAPLGGGGGGGGGGGLPSGGQETPPSISGATIKGTIRVNARLSTDTVSSGNVGTLTYQWYRTTTNGAVNTASDTAIGTNSTYQLTTDDKDNYIYYIVRGTGSLSKASNIVGPIESATIPSEKVTGLTFADIDRDTNQISGTLHWIEPTNVSNITSYNIYASSDGLTKGTLITTAAVKTSQIVIQQNTAFSNYILTICRNASGESATFAAIAIIDVFNLEQDAPSGLSAVAPTSVLNDGKITGVTTAMEYKASSGGAAYVSVTGTEIAGLTAGTYFVRYVEKEGYNAGTPASIIVPAYVPPVSPFDVADQIGIVITPPALGSDTIAIYTSIGAISYTLEKDVAADTIAGQIVTYAVNDNGNIGILNSVRASSQTTCASITINSGMQVQVEDFDEILARYTLSGITISRYLDSIEGLIFAYSGTSPGAINNEYRVIERAKINDGTINSPVNIYIDKDNNCLLAMLVPFSACTLINYDQSAPTGLTGVAPTSALNDGKITGVTTAMEYKSSTDGAIYIAVSGSAINGLTEGTYFVRYAAKPGYNASTPASVMIPAFVPLQDQASPSGITTVSPSSGLNNDGKIKGVTTAMEYKLSTESDYHAVTGTEVTGLAAGIYNVRYAAKEGYNASPSVTVGILSYGLTPPSAPVFLNGITPTSGLNNNGKITNVNDSMEYKLSTDENYTPVTGTEITGLVPGSYLVRYKGGLTYLASNPLTVVVLEYAVSELGVFLSTVDSANRIISIFNSDGQTISYELESWVNTSNPVRGQLVSYSLNSSGNIQTMNTSGYTYIETNLEIQQSDYCYIQYPTSPTSKSGTSFNGDEIIFTYSGSTPGAIDNIYKATTLECTEFGIITSPCAFYVGNSLDGILIPAIYAKGLKPTGLSGCSPSSPTDTGKITGVTTDMEYKLSTNINYLPVTGTELTGLMPGTYCIRYSTASEHGEGSPIKIKIISSFDAADQIGIVITPPTSGGNTISIFTSKGAISSYVIEDNVLVDTVAGQIVTYAVNNNGEIGIMNSLKAESHVTNASIIVDSGFTFYSGGGVRYSLSGVEKARAIGLGLVFTYSGTTPGAINNEFRRINKSDIREGTIISPVNVYVESDNFYLQAVLIPFSACSLSTNDQSAPTGLSGVAPTSAANTNGKITGTTTAMEYRLASAASSTYKSCTVTETTVSEPGIYHVRYSQTGELNAGTPAAVTVPAYDGRSLTIEDITEITYVKGSNKPFEFYLVGTNEQEDSCSALSLGTLTVKNGSDTLISPEAYGVFAATYPHDYGSRVVFTSTYLESLSEGDYQIEFSVQTTDGKSFNDNIDMFILPSTSMVYYNQPIGGGILEVYEFTWDDDSYVFGSPGELITSGGSVSAGGLSGIMISMSSIPANKYIETLTIQEKYSGKTVEYNEENYNLITDFLHGGCTIHWKNWGTVTINVELGDGAKNTALLQDLAASYEDDLGNEIEIQIPVDPYYTGYYEVTIRDPEINPNEHINLFPIVLRESAANITQNNGVTLSNYSGVATIIVTAENNTSSNSYFISFIVDRTNIFAEIIGQSEFTEGEDDTGMAIHIQGINDDGSSCSTTHVGDSYSIYCDSNCDNEADGEPLDESYYTIANNLGDVTIELSNDFIKTLSAGIWEVTVNLYNEANGINYRSSVALQVIN